MPELTIKQLETHLWGAADILRGRIDSSDYKHYIFGLLFYKRICDVWEEEYEDRLAKYKNEELAAHPDEHRFHVPEGAFWKDVRQKTTNIGEHLNAAFHAIEDANMKLRGVFQDVDFNNKERFPDETLEMLLQHFEKHRLRKCDVEPDILGNAYEYLIAKFADDAGKKGGEFYTPKMVVRTIARCLRLDEGMSVYDPACGSGGMLLEAFHALEREGKNPRSLTLAGQEINLNTWAISQMNLFLHDIDDADVRRGDTLRDPKHLASEGRNVLRVFDRVMANPPFSLKKWGHSFWSNGDPFGRDQFGCPPKSYGDLAFVQHMIASANSKGMVGVVVPHGVLFRGGSEKAIRMGMLENDLIEAIIGLGDNLFYGAGIPTAILILNKSKPAKRRGSTLIINGEKEWTARPNTNILTEENADRLVNAFHSYRDEPKFCQVVSLEEIRANDHNLNIRRYVSVESEEPPISVPAGLSVLETLSSKCQLSDKESIATLHGLFDGQEKIWDDCPNELPRWDRVVASPPPRWKRVSAGKVFNERKEVGFPHLPLLAVTRDGVIPQKDMDRRDTSNPDKSRYKRICPGDIAYNTMRMWQGRSALSDIEGIVSPAYTVLIPRAGINPRFISYMLKLPILVNRFRELSQGIVSDTWSLKFREFSRIELIIPDDEEEQIAIANTLDRLVSSSKEHTACSEAYSMLASGAMQGLLTGRVRGELP